MGGPRLVGRPRSARTFPSTFIFHCAAPRPVSPQTVEPQVGGSVRAVLQVQGGLQCSLNRRRTSSPTPGLPAASRGRAAPFSKLPASAGGPLGPCCSCGHFCLPGQALLRPPPLRSHRSKSVRFTLLRHPSRCQGRRPTCPLPPPSPPHVPAPGSTPCPPCPPQPRPGLMLHVAPGKCQVHRCPDAFSHCSPAEAGTSPRPRRPPGENLL